MELIEDWKARRFDLDAEFVFDVAHMFSVDVSSGINSRSITGNLFALKQILTFFAQPEHAQSESSVYVPQNEEDRKFFQERNGDFWILANIVLAWFFAAGIKHHVVETWLHFDVGSK